ncbi:unnamed protein product [Brassica rapa subsp. trilocularis]
MNAISDMEYDYIASGQYAKVVHPPPGQSVLKLSQDMIRPTSSHVSQTQLKRLLFPFGCVKKVLEDVRKLATQFVLSLTPPNKDIKHSQRKCFLGKRQGLRLLGGPWYVVEKDTKNNVVFVSRNYYSIDKRRRVRHRLGFFSCSFEMEADGDVEVVHLDEDDQGVILESWDDQCFPVCAKSLQFAAMQDKTKLGKSVKIMTMPVTTSVEAEPGETSEEEKLVNA